MTPSTSGAPSAQGEISCAGVTDISEGITGVRYDAPAASSWWVSYGLVQNSCSAPVTLGEMKVTEAAAAPAMRWRGEVARTDPGERPFAFWAEGEGPPLAAVTGSIVEPGETVQIVAKLQQIESDRAQNLPHFALPLSAGPARSEVALASPFTFCTCSS